VRSGVPFPKTYFPTLFPLCSRQGWFMCLPKDAPFPTPSPPSLRGKGGYVPSPKVHLFPHPPSADASFPNTPICSGQRWLCTLQRMRLFFPIPPSPLYPIRSGRTQGPQRHQPRDRPRHPALPFPGIFLEKRPWAWAERPFPLSPLQQGSRRARARIGQCPGTCASEGDSADQKKKKKNINRVWQPAFIASCAYIQVSDVPGVGSVRVGRMSWFGLGQMLCIS
jgi:hypothetical protein